MVTVKPGENSISPRSGSVSFRIQKKKYSLKNMGIKSLP